MDPGSLIRKLRLQSGVSQRELALRARSTQAAVSAIERGLTNPTWSTVRALLLALGYEARIEPRPLPGRFDLPQLARLERKTPA